DWPRIVAAAAAGWGGYAVVALVSAGVALLLPPPAQLPMTAFGPVFWLAGGAPLVVAAVIAAAGAFGDGGAQVVRQVLTMAAVLLGWLLLGASVALVDAFFVFRPLNEAVGSRPDPLAALQWLVLQSEMPWVGLVVAALAAPLATADRAKSLALAGAVAVAGVIGAVGGWCGGFGLTRALVAGWSHAGTLAFSGALFLVPCVVLLAAGITGVRSSDARRRRRALLLVAGAGLAGGLLGLLGLHQIVEAMFAPQNASTPPAGAAEFVDPSIFADAVIALGALLPVPLPIGAIAVLAIIPRPPGAESPPDGASRP
ncbi:MAG: hypothetical protein ACYTGX_19265, partial [Planctomycetota bacterium]